MEPKDLTGSERKVNCPEPKEEQESKKCTYCDNLITTGNTCEECLDEIFPPAPKEEQIEMYSSDYFNEWYILSNTSGIQIGIGERVVELPENKELLEILTGIIKLEQSKYRKLEENAKKWESYYWEISERNTLLEGDKSKLEEENFRLLGKVKEEKDFLNWVSKGDYKAETYVVKAKEILAEWSKENGISKQ